MVVASLSPARKLYIYDSVKQRLINVTWDGQTDSDAPMVLYFSKGHYDAWHLDAGNDLPVVKENIHDFKAARSGGRS